MKSNLLTAALAAFLLLPLLATTAYAGSDEDVEQAEPEEIVAESTVAESAVDENTAFTPDGTGTVLDNATDEDGKEFYTITTEAGNVYYLIIDKARNDNNVYFLNAVTEADLLALAEPSESVSAVAETETDTAAETGTTAEPDPEPEDDPDTEPGDEIDGNSNMGTIILVLVIVVGGGGAGYYFKIYRPKHEAPEDEYEGESYGAGLEDYDGNPYGEDDYGAEQEADSPLWDGDESEGDDQ